MKFELVYSKSTNPVENLSAEACLLDMADAFRFFLWQNDNTVVIGKNQNPWRETRFSDLERDGGRLVRRQTGGGAVYHDMGNLNFSFTAPNEIYDVPRQLGVIVNALKMFGVSAEKSGRNDITADGKKFSGNAFCQKKVSSLHHGTLLVSSDMTVLPKYLQVSKAKMAAKGVSSVGARVVNLSDINSNISIGSLKKALFETFANEYGCEFTVCDVMEIVPKHMHDKYTELYSSWDWIFGQTPSFETLLEQRFEWGEIQLNFTAKNGMITDGKLYSDALDSTYIDKANENFIGLLLNDQKIDLYFNGLADKNSPMQMQMARDIAGLIQSM